MKTYITTRFPYTAKRKIVWQEICRYLNRQFINKQARVLELGCGYGDFIGNITLGKRVGIEINEYFKPHIKNYPNVTIYFGDALDVLPAMGREKFDVVFCSNYFEHFDMIDIKRYLTLISDVLSDGGQLIVIQPNFQLCAPKYFDDWTHKSVFSHVSFSDLLSVHGYQIEKCYKAFLPFSMKSKLPINRLFVRLYLLCPIKLFAGQFLIISTIRKTC